MYICFVGCVHSKLRNNRVWFLFVCCVCIYLNAGIFSCFHVLFVFTNDNQHMTCYIQLLFTKYICATYHRRPSNLRRRSTSQSLFICFTNKTNKNEWKTKDFDHTIGRKRGAIVYRPYHWGGGADGHIYSMERYIYIYILDATVGAKAPTFALHSYIVYIYRI